MNDDHPGMPVLGGMASGGGSGQNRVLVGRRWHDHGAAAALVYGAARIRSVVSQGCRPIGRPFIVTKAEANVILELGGMPAMARLQEVFGDLTAREQQLVRQGLHVGRVLSEYQDRFGRGDFLVRNVIGADPNLGAIAIGDYVRAGQTVQFHIRDAETADEDLRMLLAPATEPAGTVPFCGGHHRDDDRGAKGDCPLFRRPACSCSPATAAALACFPSRITTPPVSATASARSPRPASSRKGKSAPSAARISSTASRPASRCLAALDLRRLPSLGGETAFSGREKAR